MHVCNARMAAAPRWPDPGGRDKEAASEDAMAMTPHSVEDAPLPPSLHLTLLADSRAYTVKGPQLALAMLRGFKRFENRSFKLRPGWYHVHAAQEGIGTEHSQILASTWPSAPSESQLARSAVYGMVLHGAALEVQDVSDPWAIGPFCHPVLQSVELPRPSTNVDGHRRVWHLQDDVLQRIEKGHGDCNVSGFWCA